MRIPHSRLLPLTAALVLGSALAACGSSSPGAASSSSTGAPKELTVVASTDVWGDVVRQIAGDSVRLTSIISDPDQDPHSYEASTTNQLALSKADLIIENGGGYDDFVETMLKTAGNDSATLINAVDLSGKKAPAGGELNEHVWYDFPTVQKVATAITDDLSTALPGQAAQFRANAAAFTTKLDGLIAREATIKKAHAGEGVAITEPVSLYLLEAGGLVNKTPSAFSEAIEEGSDVPVPVLNDTLKLFRSGEVKLLAYNAQTSGPETEKVLTEAKSDHVGIVPVTETLPEGKDYVSWMTANLEAVSAALG
jgi:zinc/manganese transport system substrate-binding protein